MEQKAREEEVPDQPYKTKKSVRKPAIREALRRKRRELARMPPQPVLRRMISKHGVSSHIRKRSALGAWWGIEMLADGSRLCGAGNLAIMARR
jgi:hypothetical protein